MDKRQYTESIDKLAGDQQRRESKLLAELLGDAHYDELAAYENEENGVELVQACFRYRRSLKTPKWPFVRPNSWYRS